jgi:GNAT superfamily N-acetyltransferase
MNDPSTLRLRESDRPALAAHFRSLGTEDRRLRFGGNVSDDVIDAYVARIDFVRDCVFAVHDDALHPVAVVHVARSGADSELGLSVLPEWRGHGYGDALFRRAVNWLRNRNIPSVLVHCLAENAAMLHLARKHGMRMVFGGGESDARLALDAPTPETHATEWMQDQHGFAVHLMRHNARWIEALFAPA